MRIHALVLAGGSGDRFGAEMPKQFVRLAGEPILARTIRILASAGIDQLVVVSHPNWIDETRELVDGLALPVPMAVVAGGMEPVKLLTVSGGWDVALSNAPYVKGPLLPDGTAGPTFGSRKKALVGTSTARRRAFAPSR